MGSGESAMAIPENAEDDIVSSAAPVVEEPNAPSAKSPSQAITRHRDDGGASDLPMKRRRKKDRPAKKRRDNRKSRYDADYVEKDERQNAEFAEYYRVQGIVPKTEHAKLLQTLASPLPSSFRVVVGGSFGDKIQSLLAGEMRELFEAVEGAKPPTTIPWVPGGRAWMVSAPRQMLRRDNCLSKFHRFLVECTELGAIFRQEAVSMIPPLLLDAYRGCSVLDMCAAPGSKTGQMLEMFGSAPGDSPQSLAQPGVVIANDADIKRCWMLTHQLKRFSSSQLLVTNHDAQFFPKVMLFDRVLCDVPCSGDGTLRKAPDIWRRWNCGMGMGLHRMQRLILVRGIELLKPGGRLVYSTCSLNPIENEAVVASVLHKFGPDVIELVDVSDRLPHLKRRPGMTDWKVRDLSGEKKTFLSEEEEQSVLHTVKEPKDNVQSPAEAEERETLSDLNHLNMADDEKKDGNAPPLDSEMAEEGLVREKVEKSPLRGWFTNYNQVRPRRRRKVTPSMFPPSKERLESGLCPLERCLRLIPQDQDTGGFFVAVFQKKADVELTKKEMRIVNDLVQKENTDAGEEQGKTQIQSESVVEMNDLEQVEERVEKNGKPHGKRSAEILVPEPVQKDVEKTAEKQVEEGLEGNSPENTAEAAKSASSLAQTTENVNGELNAEEQAEQPTEQKSGGRKGSRLITDDPLTAVENLNLEALRDMSDFFGLDYSECRIGLMTRGGDKDTFKKVALVSPAVRNLLRISIGSSEADTLPAVVRRDRLRVIHAGVTLMERSSRRDSACRFRIVSDGARTLASTMQKRVGELSSEDFGRLVKKQTLQICSIAGWEQRRDIDGSGSGSMVCVDKAHGEIAVVWKSRHALTLLMPRTERAALMRRVGAAKAEADAGACEPGANAAAVGAN